MQAINELPLALAFLALFGIVMVRANATYWIGRGLRAGASRSRWGLRLDSSAMARAERLVARWGAGAVVVSFLTIGLQTAINASAWAMRMPQRRYLPAVVVGCLLWATVYSALGAFLLVGARTLLGI